METPRFPLKRHIRCAEDGLPLTAYTVKKKNIDYYKCNKVGCKNNISAKKVHRLYEELLDTYNVPEMLMDMFREVVEQIIFANDKEQSDALSVLKKQKSELENRLKKCKVKFGMDEIDEDIYTTTVEVIQEKLAKIEIEIARVKRNLSNLTSTVDDVASTCCKLGSLWSNSELELCQKIQNLLFPSGIFWDKENENYRTLNPNQALDIIHRISGDYKNKKEEKSENFSSKITLCG